MDPERIERWYRTQLTSLVRAINRAIAREVLPIIQQEKPHYQDAARFPGYVSLRPDPDQARAIADHLESAGLSGCVSCDDLHVTLFYARAGIEAAADLQRVSQGPFGAQVTNDYEIMGEGKWRALVVQLDSPDLQARFNEIRATGAEHSYPEYRPHLSLKYQPTEADLERIREAPILIDQLVLQGERWKHIQDSVPVRDGWADRISAAMAVLGNEFLSQSFRDQLRRLAVEAVSRTEANSTQQFIDSINRAVGVDVSAMIQREGLTEYLDAAVFENVNLITSIPQQYLTQVEGIILNGMRSGLTPGAISKQLQAQAGVTKRRAAFIARDQVAKLNSDIVRRRQQSAGISHYKVITSNDERVTGNPAGRYPNAKIKCWEIARKDIGFGPGVYTWKDGAEYAGQKGLHPGKHHPGCRCTASPVFEWQLPKSR